MTNSDSSINWPSLLQEHESWLRRVLYARLGAAHEVDDVMQEVALAVVRQKPGVSDVSKAPAYLYQMVVRQAAMFCRSAGRRRAMETRFAETQSSADAHEDSKDPLIWLMANERRGQVRQALEHMSASDREILLLKHAENMSYREIAQALETTTSAVEARLYRARTRLRTQLERIARIN